MHPKRICKSKIEHNSLLKYAKINTKNITSNQYVHESKIMHFTWIEMHFLNKCIQVALIYIASLCSESQ